MISSRSLLRSALEESLSQEQTANEIERVWFAKIDDFSQFDRATETESHEQWEYRLFRDGKPIGTLRSRMIDEGDRYELTIKTYRKEGAGSIESNLAATDDVHEVVSALADRVLRKIRYVIPATVKHNGEDVDLKWEIDVFLLPDGEREPWVKIDLEIPDESVPTPSIPFKYADIINASFDARMSDEQRGVVDALFERVKSKQ